MSVSVPFGKPLPTAFPSLFSCLVYRLLATTHSRHQGSKSNDLAGARDLYHRIRYVVCNRFGYHWTHKVFRPDDQAEPGYKSSFANYISFHFWARPRDVVPCALSGVHKNITTQGDCIRHERIFSCTIYGCHCWSGKLSQVNITQGLSQ